MSVAKAMSDWLCTGDTGVALLVVAGGGALLVGLALLPHPASTALTVRATVTVAIRVAIRVAKLRLVMGSPERLVVWATDGSPQLQ
jgi:hypothetical protein